MRSYLPRDSGRTTATPAELNSSSSGRINYSTSLQPKEEPLMTLSPGRPSLSLTCSETPRPLSYLRIRARTVPDGWRNQQPRTRVTTRPMGPRDNSHRKLILVQSVSSDIGRDLPCSTCVSEPDLHLHLPCLCLRTLRTPVRLDQLTQSSG